MVRYETMYNVVKLRMDFIEQSSLEHEELNREWRELFVMRDTLLRLIKIQKENKK